VRRVVAVLLAAQLLILAALIGLAPGASAHTALRSSQPANGARLTEPPQQIELTFTEKILKGAAQILLSGPGGEVPTTVGVAGPVVSTRLPSGLSGGRYTVLWRVTSADGHPIAGQLSFVIESGPAPSSAAPAPSGSATSVAGQVGAVVAQAQSTPSPSAVPEPVAVENLSPAMKAALALLVVLGGGAAVAGLIARTRRGKPGPPKTP
jgi:methionine-rich copper-binding protein CopC